MDETTDPPATMTTPLTTAQAAELARMSRSSFRGAMTRLRAAGQDFRLPGDDLRSPKWDGDALAAWLANRAEHPGRGRWGEAHLQKVVAQLEAEAESRRKQ